MPIGDPYGFKRAQSMFGGHRRPSREPAPKVSPGKILTVHEYECEGCGHRSYIQEGMERAFPCSECGGYRLARRADYDEARKTEEFREGKEVSGPGASDRRAEEVMHDGGREGVSRSEFMGSTDSNEGSRPDQPRLLDDMGTVLAMAILCVLIGFTALHPVISVVNGCCAGTMLGIGWMTILRRARRRSRWVQ